MTAGKETFRVLTIDGGGIKGIYSATVLQVFEEYFQTKVIDHFDLICGTSTGAIIAAGLAAGYSAKQIANFYLEKGPQIFRNIPFLSRAKQMFVKSKYTGRVLKSELKSLLGGKQFKDSLSYLCIPTFDLTAGHPYVFKTSHAQELYRDEKVYLWKAALASSSAPTYFPVYNSSFLQGHKFVDGGIWANNPSLIGLIEAQRYFVGPNKPFQKLILISLSSISEHFAKVKVSWWANSVVGWNKQLLDLFMAGQTTSTEQMVQFLVDSNNGEYLRIPPPKHSTDTIKRIKLDNAGRKVLEHIIGLGQYVANNLKNNNVIKDVFTNLKPTTPKELKNVKS